jgi:hypothetical protein
MEIEDRQALSSYLQPSESLLWVGRPSGGILFRKSDAFMIPFSFLWAGFAVYWEYHAYTSGAPPFFLLFGAFFVLGGFYITIGRFLIDMLKRDDTIYGLTNERALILSGILGRSLRSLSLSGVPEVRLTVHFNGRGTIAFGTLNGLQGVFASESWPGTNEYTPPAFESIENAQHVYHLIQTAKRTR